MIMPQFQPGTGVPIRPHKTVREVTAVPVGVRTRNRRRKYLETHPEYLNDPELELAGLFCLSVALTLETDRSRIPSTMGPLGSQMAKPCRERSRWEEEGI